MSTESMQDDSFMRQWEMGSPMRTFIYYLQRATCGALAYLVLHQTVLGLRLLGFTGATNLFFEWLLNLLSLPGDQVIHLFLDPIRPINMPAPLASFFLNIVIYFSATWLGCYLYNLLLKKTFLGRRRDPFKLQPKEN